MQPRKLVNSNNLLLAQGPCQSSLYPSNCIGRSPKRAQRTRDVLSHGHVPLGPNKSARRSRRRFPAGSLCRSPPARASRVDRPQRWRPTSRARRWGAASECPRGRAPRPCGSSAGCLGPLGWCSKGRQGRSWTPQTTPKKNIPKETASWMLFLGVPFLFPEHRQASNRIGNRNPRGHGGRQAFPTVAIHQSARSWRTKSNLPSHLPLHPQRLPVRLIWVWLKIKELGLRRLECVVPFTQVPFRYMFLSHSHFKNGI